MSLHRIARDFHITTVYFQIMPKFTAVPIRGYTLVNTASTVEAVKNMTAGGIGFVSPTALAENLSTYVQIDECGGTLNIPGGWEQQHCSVSIEVRCVWVDNTVSMMRFRGYTDRVDFAPMTGIPAMDLIIHINSIEEVRLTEQYTAAALTSVNQVFCDNGQNTHRPDKIYTVRPGDVLSMSNVAGTHATNQFIQDPTQKDTHAFAALTNVPATERMATTASVTWLGAILNSYIGGLNDAANGVPGLGSPTDLAVSHVTNMTTLQNPFLQLMARKVANNAYSLSGWIPWSAIVSTDPSLATDTQRVVTVKNSGISTESGVMNSSSSEARIGQLVAVNVRPWMYASRLASVSFTATNMTITGDVDVQFTDKVLPLVSLDEMSQQALVRTFVENIKVMLMPQITQSGVIPVHIVVHASHSANTTVVVTLGAGGNLQPTTTRFSYPAFMDNTFSPILSQRSPMDIGKTVQLLTGALEYARNGEARQPLLLPHQISHAGFHHATPAPISPVNYGSPPPAGSVHHGYPPPAAPAYAPVQSTGPNSRAFDL